MTTGYIEYTLFSIRSKVEPREERITRGPQADLLKERPPMTEKAVKTLLVRMPVEVKEWLERESGRNLSSQGSEVVRAVRLRMESERRDCGRPMLDRAS